MPTWDQRPFAEPPKDKPKKWTVMLGDRKFATVKGEIWWTKDLVQAVKQAALAGPEAKVITEDEFAKTQKDLLASQIHKRLPGLTMRCGMSGIAGMLCTDTEAEVTCPKCKEPPVRMCVQHGCGLPRGHNPDGTVTPVPYGAEEKTLACMTCHKPVGGTPDGPWFCKCRKGNQTPPVAT